MAVARSVIHLNSSPPMVLGLSVSYSSAGFGIVHFGTGAPVKFGIINTNFAEKCSGRNKRVDPYSLLSKTESSFSSGITDVGNGIPENKTEDIEDVDSLDLRKLQSNPLFAEQHSNNALSATESICDVLERLKSVNFKCIGLEDTIKDRSVANSRKDLQKYVESSKMQGMILTELHKIFPQVPIIQVHPKRARESLFLGEEGDRQAAREKLYTYAQKKIEKMPSVKTKNGKVCRSSFQMSDAWATALFARLEVQVAEKMRDPSVVSQVRKQVLESKKIRKLDAAVRELHPRKSALELKDVMEKSIAHMTKQRIYKTCASHV